MVSKGTSPTATGPGGAQFEAKVGAYYLLALLLDAEPRGLPGARIERIQLQAATDGLPLDDVIVHARLLSGAPATAEIQVKRTVSFSPSDVVFRDVVQQIVEAVKAGRIDPPHPDMLAIATALSTSKINGPYQEVLLWARENESAEAFFRKLSRVGVSNESMRLFVSTLRAHVTEFGGVADDDAIWKILRRLQILVFDFSAEQGQSDSLVRERCAQALDPAERAKAGALWSALCEIAQDIAVSGGEIAGPALRVRVASTYGLTLAGLRQNGAARGALFDASRNALNDIRDQVGSVKLSRRDRLDAINARLDEGRYVEILGDAGVGKSGILRSLAEQTSMGANVVVLSPNRTTPGGWLAMRNVLGFDGSAKELLSEVAASGGAAIFLDNLNFFSAAEQATAVDLVRAAGEIEGISVVVTARRSFGTEEPNWLPGEALDALGRATPVIVDDLTEVEVRELRDAAPQLAALLGDSHPARDVARNLFRLDRLVRQTGGEPIPHTEAEMAFLWWQTGDGRSDDQARERTRILRELADSSLGGSIAPFDTSTRPAAPLNALIKSGTLHDLGGERMVFRHDVFRDWTVANLLNEDPDKISNLPLARPAPVSLSRGVELASRLAIEKSPDEVRWVALLRRLSQSEVHGSWRRAVVMGLVRSEMGASALARVESELLADSGNLLRELIRTLMAIDVVPMSQFLAATGLKLPENVADLSMPSGPSWRRLVVWILALGNRLPSRAIPDVAELYIDYASATLLFDPIVKNLVAQIHAWLMEIEGRRADRTLGNAPALGDELDYDKRQSLHDYLRSGFLALSTSRPDLADQYVRLLLEQGRTTQHSAESVIKSSGTLAQSAPAALAELTAATLIEQEAPKRRGRADYGRREAFTFTDNSFLSPSPARGPFLDLLVHSPRNGLALIRRIVQHAATFDKNNAGAHDTIEISFESGPRQFSLPDSYIWSRDAQGHYCVTSALMSLEAWAHRRIEAGESIDAVIADVLGEGETPAAYLLVVVDLLLSHWPKTRMAAIPFVGAPELLSLDRTRQVRDSMGLDSAMFGEREPRGLANRESLKKRQSRSVPIERLLPYYLFYEPVSDGDAVRSRLTEAAARLGPYEAHSSMADPRLMVVYALNQLDLKNYQTRQVKDNEGNDFTYYEYISPATEAEHLTPKQARAAAQMASTNLRSEIAMALEKPEKSSPDFLQRAIAWARETDASGEPQPDFEQGVLITAALVMRDGDTAQRHEHGDWAAAKFQAAMARSKDRFHSHRSGLRYNPVGIAAIGMSAAARNGLGLADAHALLELAATGDPAAAQGFGANLEALYAIDSRLPKSLLRCAFTGCKRAYSLNYGEEATEEAARQRQVSEWREDALNSEWRWLRGESGEPSWPEFPDAHVGVRDKIYLGTPPDRPERKERQEPTFYADHQSAAVWLSKFMGRELEAPDWLRPAAHHYRDWTSTLNGAGLDSHDELSRSANDWNAAYYRLVARSLPGLDAGTIDALCLAPILCLPDESFMDVSGELILPLDEVYFAGKSISADDLLRIRTVLADRLRQTSSWRRYADRPGYGIEMHLGPALGALFMAEQGFRTPPKCYVTAVGIPRAVPFIELLTDLATQTPSLFVAMVALSIVSVSPEYPFVSFGVKTIQACIQKFPDDTKFWADYGIGKSFCDWIDALRRKNGHAFLDREGVRSDVERIVSDLIRLGIAEATVLEIALSDS